MCGELINHIMALALSASEVNAAMGKICAAPTAGSCGILPAVLTGVSEHYGYSKEITIHGLLTASGIGAVIMQNATVAGLVQLPCAQRNASQAVNALLSADLALGGMNAVIPADEVIEAMYKTGRQLPSELKETAQGGIAITPTGQKLKEKIFS